MRIQRRTLKKARIEIIPMIDTIFFLLVFFMISTLSMAQYRGMPVNLPKAASGHQAPAESAAITIDKERRIFLNKKEVDRAALGDLLRQQLEQNADLLVVINADDGVEQQRERQEQGEVEGAVARGNDPVERASDGRQEAGDGERHDADRSRPEAGVAPEELDEERADDQDDDDGLDVEAHVLFERGLRTGVAAAAAGVAGAGGAARRGARPSLGSRRGRGRLSRQTLRPR